MAFMLGDRVRRCRDDLHVFTGWLDRLGSGCHPRSEEHTSELQSRLHLVCRLLLEKKKHLPLPTPQRTPYEDTNVISQTISHYLLHPTHCPSPHPSKPIASNSSSVAE